MTKAKRLSQDVPVKTISKTKVKKFGQQCGNTHHTPTAKIREVKSITTHNGLTARWCKACRIVNAEMIAVTRRLPRERKQPIGPKPVGQSLAALPAIKPMADDKITRMSRRERIRVWTRNGWKYRLPTTHAFVPKFEAVEVRESMAQGLLRGA